MLRRNQPLNELSLKTLIQKVVHAPPFGFLNFSPKQRGTQTKRRNTLIPKKAQNVQTVTKNRRTQTGRLTQKEAKRDLKPLSLRSSLETSACRSRPASFISLATSLSFKISHPFHGERGFLAVTIPQESYTGTVNTVKEVSSAILSSPNTHPSFLGIEGPLTSGNLTPPVRPPNPPGRERSLHYTSSSRGRLSTLCS